MHCPYGEDDSDLPLEKMTNSMWSDLDSINSTFIDNSRLGSGEGLKGLVRSKSKGNPTVVALRGSDLIRKSSPAAMAAAVYAQQQEDLKLPEEVKQRRFGEGGVGDCSTSVSAAMPAGHNVSPALGRRK